MKIIAILCLYAGCIALFIATVLSPILLWDEWTGVYACGQEWSRPCPEYHYLLAILAGPAYVVAIFLIVLLVRMISARIATSDTFRGSIALLFAVPIIAAIFIISIRDAYKGHRLEFLADRITEIVTGEPLYSLIGGVGVMLIGFLQMRPASDQ